ncbi:hypothetical protein M885DRAFT_9167 [Pelagophyceae sp. CCMP2097]|nr:hypothetical protein M885DRAFT_9167 [Pelagophyceae sp. CCMP2097]
MSRVQAVEAGAARGAGQGGLYSYSRLLEIVNANTSSTGVKLEVKKKVSDYEYQPVDETDIANADFDIRLGQVVKTVAALPRAKKLQFSKDMRDAGNERFHAGDHKPAIEMYAQAMAGLDLGSDDAAVNDATLKDVALPIMTNMALSFLELRRPRHALSLCDQALKIDANCVKAHLRRSKALRMLDEYTAAREACEMAMSLARTDEERQAAQSALRKAVRLAVNTRTAAVQHGAKIRAALATEAFYADKPPAGKKKRSATAVGPP